MTSRFVATPADFDFGQSVANRRIVNRLVAKHFPPVTSRHPTVAVDFDGRIIEWQDDQDMDLSQARLRDGVRRAMDMFHQAGIKVLVWTARSDVDDIEVWLKRQGIYFDTINTNPDFEPGSRKMYADVYLDDRGEGDPDATWDELVELVFSRIFGKVRQPANSWEELEELSGHAQPELEKLLKSVSPDARVIDLSDDLLLGEFEAQLLQPGSVIVLPPVKEFKRAREKVESDYDGRWNKLFDVNRAALVFDSKNDLDAALERLRGETLLARPPKDRFTSPLSNGYRDFLVNPRLPCGMVCEVQLHLKPMLIAREREKLSYDVVRAVYAALDREGREELTPAEAEAVRRARKTAKRIYARAWDECVGDEAKDEEKGFSRPVNRLKHLVTKTPGPHKYSSTQFDLLPAGYGAVTAALILREARHIAEEDLAEDGRETDPHITVKYGLLTDDPEEARQVVQGFGPVSVRLGSISVFEATPDRGSDVVKIAVASPGLVRLNQLVSEAMDSVNTHPTYQPHVALAYVKAGKGQKYAGSWPGEGTELTFYALTFSNRAGEKTVIPLGSKFPPSRVEREIIWRVSRKGLVGDSIRSAGEWLAAKWTQLEARYGRRGALAMAVAMIGTFPVPGNIPAIIAAAEAIRGLQGYLQREYDGDVEKLMKGDTVMDVAPQYQLRLPVDRLKHYRKGA